MRNRVKELRLVTASELHRNPKNWRRHPEPQKRALAALLNEIGFAGAEIARELPDGSLELIDGHCRADLAGDEKVPVLILDVDESEADKILATFDPIGAMAESDGVALAELLRTVQTQDQDLADMLTALLEDAGGLDGLDDEPGEIVEDDVPEPPVDPITKPGDLWILGRHRVLCGDSTKAEDVGRLMGGAKARCIFTDPPYNVASESVNFAADCSASMNNLANADWDKHFDFAKTFAVFESIMDRDCVVYVCTSHWLAPDVWAWMKTWASFSSYCVWCKPNPMPSLSMRHWTWATELIAYGVRGKWTSNFPKGSHALSWWDIAKKKETDHPTEKPVEISGRAIGFSSAKGDLVVDLFFGTGSTLIAAEQLGRTCYGMEISPAYVDVIVKRWENLTGQTAQLTNG